MRAPHESVNRQELKDPIDGMRDYELPAIKRYLQFLRCYLDRLKQQSYLAYDRYLGAGLPIGLGVIEGACRHHHRGALAATWRRSGAAPSSVTQQRRF